MRQPTLYRYYYQISVFNRHRSSSHRCYQFCSPFTTKRQLLAAVGRLCWGSRNGFSVDERSSFSFFSHSNPDLLSLLSSLLIVITSFLYVYSKSHRFHSESGKMDLILDVNTWVSPIGKKNHAPFFLYQYLFTFTQLKLSKTLRM